MSIPLEDKEGRPWTASAGIGWLTIAAVITVGMAAPLLGLYLSLWIYSRGRSIVPVVLYSLFFLSIPLDYLLAHYPAAKPIDIVIWASYFAAGYWLRYEIQRHYEETENWKIDIGPILTLFFGPLYINYCLNPSTLGREYRPTTLDLRK